MGFGWQEIDKTLDLCYIRVAGLHRECKPAVLFDPPNFRPRTMTHISIIRIMIIRISGLIQTLMNVLFQMYGVHMWLVN